MNVCIVRGVLSRPPEVRELRSGGVVVEYDVSVAAHDGRPTETVPVVWFEAPEPARQLEPGEVVVVVGRVRRRFFRAGAGVQSRTEVVADKVVLGRRAKVAERIVNEALASAEEAFASSAA